MIKKGLKHVIYMSYTLSMHCIGALSVHSFVCLSVSQFVHPLVLSLVLLPVLLPDMHCMGALSVHSFVCLYVCESVGQLVHPLVGSPAGPFTGWMHRCLPVRFVLK